MGTMALGWKGDVGDKESLENKINDRGQVS